MLLLIIFLPTLAALALFAAVLPVRSMRMAVSNARLTDGMWEPVRRRAEARAFWRFSSRAHVLPLGVLLLLQVVLLVVVELTGAGSVLADVFGEHHPEVALHARDLEVWGAWAEEVHAERTANATFISIMSWQWPLWPSYLVLSAVALVLHARTRLSEFTSRYDRGVRRRRRAIRANRPVRLSDLPS